MLSVERSGNRIHLFSERRFNKVQLGGVPGANFSKSMMRWTFPLTVESCLLLRETLGPSLRIGQDLASWYREQLQVEESTNQLRSATSGQMRVLPGVAPDLHHAVTVGRPYQSVGARWIADLRHTLIADTVGLGKTPQALAGVLEADVDGPYLVVCPKTAVETVWKREILTWVPASEVVTLPEGRAAREETLRDFLKRYHAGEAGRIWLVVHPEAIRAKSWRECEECGARTKFWHGPVTLDCGHSRYRNVDEHTFSEIHAADYGAIIVDEAEKMLVRETGTPNQTRRGMELLRDNCLRADSIQLAQTGTPFRGRPKLLWGTLNWLQPDQYRSFWNWAKTFFDISSGYGGSMKIGGLLPNREPMLYKSLDRIMLRRTRQEVAGHLPPMLPVGTPLKPGVKGSPIGIWLPMDPKQEKAYRAMEKAGEVDLVGGSLDAIGILAEMTRLKQFATAYGRMQGGQFQPDPPSNKLDYVLELLEEYGYPDDPQAKLVIVSQFTSVLNMFEDYLLAKHRKTGIVKITGQVTGANRVRAVDEFNKPLGEGAHVMLLNTKAGGAAITLDGGDEMIFLDETWVPDDTEQCLGRIDNRRPEHRISQRRFRMLRSLGTIEEDIAAVNAERGGTVGQLLDGRRGLEYLRAVMEYRNG